MRLFFIFMATRVVLEKVTDDYEWFLRYLQRFEPKRFEKLPEGIKNFKKIKNFFMLFFLF